MKHCFHCKNRLDITEKPSRDEVCRFCGQDLKVCRNCEFYDAFASDQCTETMAERVGDKEKANFCEYFLFKESAVCLQSPTEDRLQDLKRLFTDAS